jgi:hypothetical protein
MKSKLDTEIERGIRADQIMNDPVMVQAREHIESELWRLFKSAVPTDHEALSQIKSMQYMHGKYEAFLKSCINDGKLARIEIERKKKTLRERFLG